MLERVVFGPWAPDRHPVELGLEGLEGAVNGVPYGGGYRPFPSWEGVQVANPAAPGRVLGSVGGVGSNGEPFHLAGTAANFLRLAGTGLEVVGSGFTLSALDVWSFATWGDTAIACPGLSAKPQGYVVDGSGSGAPIDDASEFGGSGDAPIARYPWVIGRQLFLGHLLDDPEATHWSAIDNPHGWPTPQTPTAISVLSDRQTLQGGGTKIQAVRGYGQVGGFFKDLSLWRADFAGGDVMWTFARVVPDIGLAIPGLAIPFGPSVLFYSQRGWKLWAYGTELVDVGDGVVDRFFQQDVDPEHPERISFAVDPDKNYALISYVGRGANLGEPNRILLFHFPSRQWSEVHNDAGVDVEHLTVAFQPETGDTLDSMVQTPINQLAGSPDDIGTPRTVHLAAYLSTSHSLGLYRGPSLEMKLTTGQIQHAPNERAMVHTIRPMVDTDVDHRARIRVIARNDRSSNGLVHPELGQANDGECYTRVDARYHQYLVRVPAGAAEFNAFGLEIEFEADGSKR